MAIFGLALERALDERRARLGAATNRRAVWCKACGVKVEPARGRVVTMLGRAVGFLCGTCSRRW